MFQFVVSSALLMFMLTSVASIGTEVAVRDELSNHLRSDPHHRELILDALCPGLPFVDCTCKNKLIPPTFSTTCVLENEAEGEICALPPDIVCGVPAVQLSFNFLRLIKLQLPIAAEICYNDLSILDFEIPFIGDLCIDFFDPIGSLLDIVTLGLLPRSEPRNGFSTFEMCTARANGEACEMCETCDDGMGGTSVIFKCGELEKLNCTTLIETQLPASIREAPDLTKAVPFVIEAP